MGFMIGAPQARITTIVKDGALDLGPHALLTDTVNESTPAHGVIVDSVTIKDGGATATGTIQGAILIGTTHVKSDTVVEKTTGHGVIIDSVTLKDNIVTAITMKTDTVSEKTTGQGVIIDGVTLKDTGIIANSLATTGGAVTVDDNYLALMML